MVMEIRQNKISDAAAALVNFCDNAIEILLITLLAFMPFAFGAVQSWSKEIVVIISAVLFLVFLSRQILSGKGFVRTKAYLPIAALILLAVFSIIPMPQKIISIFSPQTVKLKNELLSENTKPADKEAKYTLSFYPCATKDNLRVILSAGAVFIVILNVFKSIEKIKKLLWAIIIIGAATAILAIAQDIGGNEKIYWFIAAPGKAQSGPFVNHSHFGQFMNLSIGAAIAIVLLALHREFEQRTATAAAVFDYFDSSRAKELWAGVAIISISAAAVFASLTRGGMLSMLIAMSITVLLLSARRSLRQHGWIVVTIALAALVCLLYTGFDTVYDRLTTLSTLDKYPTRMAVVKDITQPVRMFMIFGTGLGSHKFIYPMFQSIYTGLQFSYAENEYAQLLEETGISGFAVMLCFALIIAANFVKAVKNRKNPNCLAVYGLGFGLIAILIHSVTDFGQHLPANAMLSTIFCALIAILGKYGHQNIPAMQIKKSTILVIFIISIFIFSWAVAGADKARIGENYWRQALATEKQMKDSGQSADENDYEKLISSASKAALAEPENIEYQYWLNVWKWRIAVMKTDMQGQLTNQAMQDVFNIADSLEKAKTLCPTFGPVYCLLGQLQEFVLLEPAGEDNIKKGFKLEPNNELTQFAAGCLDLKNEKIDDSFEKFSKSIGLGGNFFNEIVRIYIEQEKRPDLAIKIAADDTKKLKIIAEILADNGFAGDAEFAKSKLIEVAEQKALNKTADIEELNLLGEYFYKKNNQKAAEYFAAAVAMDYGDAVLRLKYAEALAANGQTDEAVKQLKLCLRLRPKYRQAEKLLAELSLRLNEIKEKTNIK